MTTQCMAEFVLAYRPKKPSLGGFQAGRHRAYSQHESLEEALPAYRNLYSFGWEGNHLGADLFQKDAGGGYRRLVLGNETLQGEPVDMVI